MNIFYWRDIISFGFLLHFKRILLNILTSIWYEYNELRNFLDAEKSATFCCENGWF
jgi:hypothetical protein